MNAIFYSIHEWFASWFSPSAKAQASQILDQVTAIAAMAMPMVKAIDEELKPALRRGHQPTVDIIAAFLTNHLGVARDTRRTARQLADLPLPDMCVNTALFMLREARSDSASAHLLRLAIELAYTLYKSSKT